MEKVEESVASVLTQCCSEEEPEDVEGEFENKLQVFEWEKFENSLARLCGLATVLTKARARKEAAARKVESLVQAKLQVLERVDALEKLQRQLEDKQKFLKDADDSLEERTHKLKLAREKLIVSGSSLLHAAKNLSAAQARIQEAEKLLAGEAGYGRLLRLRSVLTARRRCMVAQLAALFPLIPCTNKLKCPLSAHSQHSGEAAPLTISGLHVIAPVKKEVALFSDRREYEASATALGYVAHVTCLLARFLDIRLRYPIRYRASRSYIQDFSPPNEPSTSGGAIVLPAVSNQVVEFPLFSDGQEPTRAAYAVFLLNKDLEQILHHLGATSVGPRHVLPNLKKILRIVLREGQSLA